MNLATKVILVVVCGMLMTAGCSNPSTDNKSSDPNANSSKSLRLWRDKETDEFCKWIDVNADSYKFEGGWVEVWMEVDAGGKTDKYDLFVSNLKKNADKDRQSGSAGEQPYGSLLWIRKNGDQESWKLAFRYSIDGSNGKRSGSCGIEVTLAPASSGEKESWIRTGDAFDLGDGEIATLATYERTDVSGKVIYSAKLQCRKL